MPAELGEVPLLGPRLLFVFFTWWKGARDLLWVSFIRVFNHISPNDVIPSQRPPPPNAFTLRIRIEIYELWGNTKHDSGIVTLIA